MTPAMDVKALVERLERNGIFLTIVGQNIKIRAPSAPSPESLEELRKNKADVLNYLKAREAQVPFAGPVVAPPIHAPCSHCGGSGRCKCITCGRYEAKMVWVAGPCVPCQARKRESEFVQ